MLKKDSLWSDEEIKDAVAAYLGMQKDISAGVKVVKSDVYRQLSKKWGRTESSFERRMSNISSVLHLKGRAWISGLKPLANVGVNVISVIEKYLNELDGEKDFSNATFDMEVAQKYRQELISSPSGVQVPSSKTSSVKIFIRDAAVKAWLLKQSDGLCEVCGSAAPFSTDSGIPYLEVHHVKRLADKGSDTPENAVAVCPNCHKALHYSSDRDALVNVLYSKISRLKR